MRTGCILPGMPGTISIAFRNGASLNNAAKCRCNMPSLAGILHLHLAALFKEAPFLNAIEIVPGEMQVQYAILGRRDVFEDSLVGRVAPARVGDHVKDPQPGFIVDQNPEDPAGFAASGRVVLAEERFGKIQMQLINTWFERDIVGEIAFAPGAEQLRIGRPGDRMVGRAKVGSAPEEPVAGPDVADPVHMPRGG